MEPPVTLEGEREWFARVTAPDSGIRNWAIEADGRHIGNCALHLHESGETAGFGIIIGDKAQWGKGYGTATLREVPRIGFEEMGLQRIHLTALAGNGRAIGCYQKCGFRHEGVRRRHQLKRGRWLDVVMMGILREEWEAENQTQPGDDSPRIRDCALSDYQQVAAVWRASGLSPRPSDTRWEVAKKLRRDQDLFLVACAGPRIVGSVIGGWDGRRCWVYRMAVHPEHQRQGIGTALMRELEARFQAKGSLAINLIYNSANQRADAFYRSLGYTPREGVSVMAKTLEPTEGSGRA